MTQGYIGNGVSKEDMLKDYKEGLVEMGQSPQEVEKIGLDNPFFIAWAYEQYLKFEEEKLICETTTLPL